MINLLYLVMIVKCFIRCQPYLWGNRCIFRNSIVRKASGSVSAEMTTPERFVVEKLKNLKISPTSTLLLSVSGGSDSMAMLYIFKSIQNMYWQGLQLKVIHFNHKAREESEEEAQFVYELSHNLNLEVFSFEFPNELHNGSNFQAVARSWRREQSQRVLDSFPTHNKYLVTAHHKEDQIETILLKLLRGVHISQLHGMRELNGQVLRPLLGFGKDELRQYLTSRNYGWREDLSNQKRIYKRNKIRLDLVPLLAELAGGSASLESRLLSLSRQSQDLDSFIHQQLQAHTHLFQIYQSLDAHILYFENELNLIPRFLLTQIISAWVKASVNFQLETHLIDAVLKLMSSLQDGKKSKAVTISKTKDVVAIGNELRIVNRSKEINQKSQIYSEERLVIYGNPSIFQIRSVDSTMLADDECDVLLSPNSSYEIRYIRDGDRDRNGRIVDFFRLRNIPVHERDRVIGIFPTNESTLVTALIAMYNTASYNTNKPPRRLKILQSSKHGETAIKVRVKWIGMPIKVNMLEAEE